jgi:hypothetical protein
VTGNKFVCCHLRRLLTPKLHNNVRKGRGWIFRRLFLAHIPVDCGAVDSWRRLRLEASKRKVESCQRDECLSFRRGLPLFVISQMVASQIAVMSQHQFASQKGSLLNDDGSRLQFNSSAIQFRHDHNANASFVIVLTQIHVSLRLVTQQSL